MTTVYFVRHAEPNFSNHDDMTRELSSKGLRDRALVTEFFTDIHIDLVLSSPFRRAVDTVRPLADAKGLGVVTVDGFRERRVDSGWIEDFAGFCRAQWADFAYKLSDGESLGEVQERNIAALERVLTEHRGKTVVIGSHGTALSTIINYYDPSFVYDDFESIRTLMPWMVKFTFDADKCARIEKIDLFS